MIRFSRPLGDVSPNDIDHVIVELGFSLPIDYTQFILENGNGGICRRSEVLVEGISELVDVYEFYRLIGKNSIVSRTKSLCQMVSTLPGILAFCSDSYGNPFVFRDLPGDSSVWYWDYNRECTEDVDAEIEDQFYFVARDFTEFSSRVSDSL